MSKTVRWKKKVKAVDMKRYLSDLSSLMHTPVGTKLLSFIIYKKISEITLKKRNHRINNKIMGNLGMLRDLEHLLTEMLLQVNQI